MRNETITLVFAMAIGSVSMAACDMPEQEATPHAALGKPTPAQKTSRPGWEHVPLPETMA